ncbi:MAG: class I SAM-dependent methyltransferase [Flammeovirgaceae bacterium]|nr:class I SAM-dependent methyltransferase [Flammeovirgaceae bacterium]
METTLPNIIPNPTTPHDSWAQWYDIIYDIFWGSLLEFKTDETLKVIEAYVQSGLVTDFGCGTGRLSIPLAKKGFSVHAVDQSLGMTEELKRKKDSEGLSSLFLHTNSIADFSGSQGDLSLCVFTVLNYITTEEALNASLKTFAHCTAPGGYLFFDLGDDSFFSPLGFSHKYKKVGEFEREIHFGPTQDGICNRRETGSGILNNQPFQYTDSYPMRYWSPEHVLGLLEILGFVLVIDEFEDLNFGGSSCYLMKKNK